MALSEDSSGQEAKNIGAAQRLLQFLEKLLVYGIHVFGSKQNVTFPQVRDIGTSLDLQICSPIRQTHLLNFIRVWFCVRTSAEKDLYSEGICAKFYASR